MFEYLIAKRYLRSKHRLNFISIISVLSTLGVTIGVAALVIVLSVFNGFGSLVTTMLINFDPHVRVTAEDTEKYIDLIEYLDKSSKVQSYSKFAQGKIILINNSTVEILNIKGVPIENEESTSRIEERVKFGSFDISNNDENISGIILSLPIALRLSVRTGDTVYATSASQIRNTITRLSIPNTKRFIVTGIYEISNKEYALEYSFTSLSSAQKLLNMRSRISGLEIILNDLDDSESFKRELLDNFSEHGLNVNTWYDLHKDLYRVMLI
ncbi:MAG: ABC transporter permease, partial [Melioribacteraceae bacterium]|nr:ABC transporter permease [Melioribacteraceae bacterium]